MNIEIKCPKCGNPLHWQDNQECITFHGYRDENGDPQECELSGAAIPLPSLRLADVVNRRAVLVYQAGIANVFRVTSFNLSDYGRDAVRLYQGDFYGAQCFARGLGAAGFTVRSAHCNQAGNVVRAAWSEDLDSAPFSDKITDIRIN
jgi:hypothetical protein